MRKKQFITLIVSLALVGLFLPTSQTRAQTGLLPFGGLVSSPVTCTCSPGNIWIWFTPLYLGGPINIAGPMIYSPFSTILYGYYMIGVPGKWHLGDYIPGVQACWISAKFFCFPLPAIGLMSKVGTNY
ncbi:MAG: hypothetical protein A2665_02390 [Candidatus Zambryskibacteria bacterium RIFCSPHIGHO2_01_FULL_46_30]|uniref:Uncharacterized protein n=1 Tax=Candidatus Zambryskibacteria bacterium RIFCSPHIGHO2_01_FULL_46_30 TaxID=1802739 RepID=A0A1G2T5I5_9BACT|nr:MAG: hypothetical protein A2665_02390 [Candidatus Zambryskibacteria bacterium RIFCSPHIGHO2_01_FULL_46_30]OHB06235.1 MAG: hypothetical protein A3B22_00015 [Candidatus Zambryskibacteria bacterium RIFCSPLOWO2_01_FULL_47_33]